MKTININGKDFTIEELTATLEKVKNSSPMDEVYKYHNTTEEEFNSLYKDLPKHIKGYAKECLVVEYYNKGWQPDFNNIENKYYPWFYLDGEFRLDDVYYCYDNVNIPARLCFKSRQDAEDAVAKFLDVFKESRMF